MVYFPYPKIQCAASSDSFAKNDDEQAEIGRTVLDMLRALGCRGPDSAGVALFGAPHDGRFVVRVKLGEGGDLKPRPSRSPVRSNLLAGKSLLDCRGLCPVPGSLADRSPTCSPISSSRWTGSSRWSASAIAWKSSKQTGSPENLEKTYCISQLKGTHGLGHTRLSTESRVDLSHSQPFWSHGFPDLAIVHNGHITNYHQLRRRYEQRGVRFYTENDSEVVAIYLAEQLQCRQHACSRRWSECCAISTARTVAWWPPSGSSDSSKTHSR